MSDIVEITITDQTPITLEVAVQGTQGPQGDVGSSGGGTWGSITGTLSSQTDLQTALDAKQASDADLTAIASLSGTGYARRTGTNTWTLDTPSAGIGGSLGSTDNRVLRADGTGGSTAQGSAVTIDDSGSTRITATTAGYTPALWVSDQNSTLGGAMYFEWRGAAGVNNKVKALLVDQVGLSFYRMNDAGSAFISMNPDLSMSHAGNILIGTPTDNGAKLQVNGNLTASGTVDARTTLTGHRLGHLGHIDSVTLGWPGSSFGGFQCNMNGIFSFQGRAVGLESTANGVITVNNGSLTSFGGQLASFAVANLTASGLIGLGTYTVATLPSASANAGRIAQVTDSSVTANGSAVSGGGGNRVMVFSNGTTWDVVVA